MSISEKQIEAFNRKAEAIASDNTLLEYVKEDYPTFHRNLIEDGLREQGFEVEDDDFEMDLVPVELKIEFTTTNFFEDMGLAEMDLSPKNLIINTLAMMTKKFWNLCLMRHTIY